MRYVCALPGEAGTVASIRFNHEGHEGHKGHKDFVLFVPFVSFVVKGSFGPVAGFAG
jgi:hypothetical protein